MKMVRTRFAPSPTGFMHIGNLRTAIFNYLIAKHNQGNFLLRIEDTDQAREVEGAVDFIYDTLKLCDINIDEGPTNPGKFGPYIQSKRLEIYKKYAHFLVEQGSAYYCFCTEERLDTLRKGCQDNNVTFMYDGKCLELTREEIDTKIKNNEPYVIRQKISKEGNTTYNDIVYGEIAVENSVLEDQILLKSDGYPTYNFANVIDDHFMEITHVARGNEYLMSTAKYNLLYESFGWEKPIYIHLPMVLGEDGQKLSKRNGDASFRDLYEEGYLSVAIVNYLALLGWSSPDNKEIFSMEELIEAFDPNRISKSPSTYDVKKLNWINSHYIKKLNSEELLKLTKPFLQEAYNLKDKSDDYLKEMVKLFQEELKYGKEIVELSRIFFEEVEKSQECLNFMNQKGITDTLDMSLEKIKGVKPWTVDKIKECLDELKKEANVKGKMLYMPIRIKLTNQMHGPELPEVIYLLGKAKTIEKLMN